MDIPNANPAPQQPDPMEAIRAEYDEKLNAAIGSIEKRFRIMSERLLPAPAPTAAAPAPATNEELSLKSLQAQLKASEEKRIAKTKTSAIQSALDAHDIDSDGKQFLRDHIDARHTSNIQVKDEDVYWQDPQDQTNIKPIGDFVSELVKQKGDRFRQPKAMPSGRGLRTGGTRSDPHSMDYGSMAPEDREKLSPNQKRVAAKTAWQQAKNEMR